ncbi:Diguanylate cyclase (GGDEF)-like protein/PAS domain S-box-containing protein OS=Castellaniella defragrans OX=75697 GN=HNR28_000027 PE=4 SV=1 [Castellaniella defragrans]
MSRLPHLIRALTLVLGSLGLWLCAATSQALTLRVGIYDQKPDVYIAPNGRPAGILGELLDEIARNEGWTLEPQACTWARCMQLLEAGQIDLLPDVYYTPEREKTLSFHHIPALQSWSQIYARPGATLKSINDLKGQTLAVLAGSTQSDYLRTALDALHIPARLDAVQTLEDGFKRVQNLQDDAVAADYFYGELTSPKYGLTATPIIFQPLQIFYATPKGRNPQVLAAIDRHLAAWQSAPDSFYYRTLNQWRTPYHPPALQAEGPWIIGALAGLLLLAFILTLSSRIQLGRQRRRLQSSERRFESILGSIDACVCVKDPEQRYLYANHQLELFYGVAEGALIGHRDEDFLEDPQTLEAINASDQAVLTSHQRQVTQPEIVPPGSTQGHTFLSIKAPLLKPDGTVEAICTVATDITDRVRAEASAHRLAYYDILTNLPNRRQALLRLETLLKKAHERRAMGALLVINLDGFKKINDLHGHQSGDQLLCGVAERLTRATRDRDMVARTSADEFLVLLDRLGSPLPEAARRAMQVAEKLRLSIANQAFVVMGKPAYVTASVGVTLLQPQTTSIDTAIREADMATYRAKGQGGNQITFYEQELQTEVEQRLWMEHDLLQAINTPQITLHIQPQFGADGRVTGAELLARWTHPTRGPVPPSLFIPIAEESGLINLLGEWSLGVACKTLLRLQELGETYPISLNVSPKRLMEPHFVDYVRNTLEELEAPGNRLIFEVTEGVLIQDIRAVAERMQALSRLGIRFSIDDFGTGYSNLAYLKRLPLYELKIDKSLVQDLPHDEENVAIAQLILAMADRLNLRVVAEGVETQEQSEFLFSHNCHALQGYLFARPMPIETWLETVRSRH